LEQAVVLGDEGDLAAQGLRVPAAERLAVDVDVAVTGLVEPGDDLDERGLAAPSAASTTAASASASHYRGIPPSSSSDDRQSSREPTCKLCTQSATRVASTSLNNR
jgi:hypothetical protein